MFQLRRLMLGLMLMTCTAASAAAQTRALLVFGNAGRMFPLVNLSSVGDDLSPGKTYGGGLGLQLGPKTALRASINVAESNYRGSALSLTDDGFRSTYVAMDFLVGSPSNAGFAPYLLFGGGRVTIDPAQAGTESSNKIAGHAGIGVNYVPDNSFFVLFLEASGWVHEFEMLGFNEIQINTAVYGGLVFAIPY